MSWYVAKSLETLRKEINALFPARDKTSDGGVGDDSHNARRSDHNPDYARKGVVRARDFDKDGIPADKIVEFLLAKAKAGDPRMGAGAYIIWNGVIWSHAKDWIARRYDGKNKHTHHFHFSIANAPAAYDNTAPWGLKAWLDAQAKPAPAKTAAPAPAKKAAPTPAPAKKTAPAPAKKVAPAKPAPKRNPYPKPVLGKRAALQQGGTVTKAETRYVQWAAGATVDGGWGDKTTKAVVAFQKAHGLRPDGKVGPKTLAVLDRVTR